MSIQDQIRSLLTHLISRARPDLLVCSEAVRRVVAIPLPRSLLPPAATPAPTLADAVASLVGQVFDVSGQTRTLYGPLLSARLLPSLPPPPRTPILAFALTCRTQSCASRAWAAWLCHLVGEIDTVRATVDSILAEQSPAGHFHRLTVETSLDAFVFDEFAAIHALHRLARATGDVRLYDSLRRATEYHLANTQPDNTSHQPWALAAFAESPDTRPMAEQQLHDATLYCQTHPGSHPITCLLLLDALETLAIDASAPGG